VKQHKSPFKWRHFEPSLILLCVRYAPETNKRMRSHLRMSGTSYRLDETYVKVGTEWKYL
jgi:transposase, IS6 family